MPLKDYYQILEVEPGADQSTIKKSYRRLAMKFHPDKSLLPDFDESLFRDIQEAYEVLSNPSKREQFHYERWLQQSMGTKLQGHLSAYQIYQLILDSEKYLSGVDHFRINHYTLLNILLNLFSPSRIQTILQENNADLEKNTITIAMKMSSGLKSALQLQFKERMSSLVDAYPTMNANWESIINKKTSFERKSRYTIPFILLIVIILCFLFYRWNKIN